MSDDLFVNVAEAVFLPIIIAVLVILNRWPARRDESRGPRVGAG